MEDPEGLTKDGTVVVIDSTSVTFQEMVNRLKLQPEIAVVVITAGSPRIPDLTELQISKPEVKTVAPYLQKVNRQKRNLRRL